MALMDKKQHQGRRTRKRTHKKHSRWTSLSIFVALIIVLTLGAFIFYGADRAIDAVLLSDPESVEQVVEPTPSVAAPEPVAEEKVAQQEQEPVLQEDLAQQEPIFEQEPVLEEEGPYFDEAAAEAEGADQEADLSIKQEEMQDEATPVPPGDPTMYLSIPKLGIAGTLVSDDISEEGGLAAGVGHMPGTGFPWVKGSNTYIAGHRLGYPGTPSDHIFFNLPSLGPGDQITLTDSLGQTYTYAVTEVLQVEPTDLSVTAPTGSDTISLQVCIENYNDFTTLGPNWNVRLIVRGVQVA